LWDVCRMSEDEVRRQVFAVCNENYAIAMSYVPLKANMLVYGSAVCWFP